MPHGSAVQHHHSSASQGSYGNPWKMENAHLCLTTLLPPWQSPAAPGHRSYRKVYSVTVHNQGGAHKQSGPCTHCAAVPPCDMRPGPHRPWKYIARLVDNDGLLAFAARPRLRALTHRTSSTYQCVKAAHRVVPHPSCRTLGMSAQRKHMAHAPSHTTRAHTPHQARWAPGVSLSPPSPRSSLSLAFPPSTTRDVFQSTTSTTTTTTTHHGPQSSITSAPRPLQARATPSPCSAVQAHLRP